jgi:hypothetical protein
MPVIRLFIPALILLFCGSCIEPFEPEIDESRDLVVISGMISDLPGMHRVAVSRSSSYRNPEFRPLGGCLVAVYNDRGDMVQYTDSGHGIYTADVPESFLDTGDAASLWVMTPDLKEYRSEFDRLLPCPRIDSIYVNQEIMETSDPDKNIPGIRFYLDMSGSLSESRNVLWRIQESWEYWASLIGNKLWWGDRVEDYYSGGLFRCWKELSLEKFYLGTTRNLSSNHLRQVALNFVSDETDRLSITYSILVQQQSLTPETYEYWSLVNDQVSETGGYLEKQPASVRGNIYNVNDPDEVVLGCFYASQVQEQRIFVHNTNRSVYDVPHIQCTYEPFSVIYEWDRIEYPVFLHQQDPYSPVYTGQPYCFDCRIQGGDTIRPIYWETWY